MKFSFEEEKHGKLSFADAQVAEKKTLTSFFPFLGELFIQTSENFKKFSKKH